PPGPVVGRSPSGPGPGAAPPARPPGGPNRPGGGAPGPGGSPPRRTALIAPERVSALILISTEANGPTPEQSDATQKFLEEWYDDGSRQQAAHQLASWLIGNDNWYRTIWTTRWLLRDCRGIEMAAGCLLSRDSVLERLSEITCPALVIHATDSGIPPDRARQLTHGLTGSTYVEIAGARLAVTMTHPDPVNTAMRRFLRERVVPSGAR
ncbi:alpha/beta fold hydrolase, partial [Nocardia brasiliensis]|uniref:alpha/beta fold hydrolase n=1 Tax=Nocardia brasiliensis TaxID=37326 RepID=UPI0024570E9D